jgi:hypothetical protein
MFGNLLENLKHLTKGRSRESLRRSQVKSDKTIADYIKENEMRLRLCSISTTASKHDELKISNDIIAMDLVPLNYKFEKVKKVHHLEDSEDEGLDDFLIFEQTIQQKVLEEQNLQVSRVSLEREFRPRTKSMPTNNNLQKPKPFNGKSQILNMGSSFDKIYEPCYIEEVRRPFRKCSLLTTTETHLSNTVDKYEEQSTHSDKLSSNESQINEIRHRASTMPSKSTYIKPRSVCCRQSAHDLNTNPPAHQLQPRCFELVKGKLVKLNTSRNTKSTVLFDLTKGESYNLSNPLATRKIAQHTFRFPNKLKPSQVQVKGLKRVGKSALVQRFVTSEFLGEFDTCESKF